jgi:amino acid transporter
MSGRRSLGFWSTAAIGVGGMVGGGIFAVLGLSVQITGGGAPLAFLLSGLVALLTAYSYARLSVAFPSQGGTVEFLNQAFGIGVFTGGLNILLWMSYIVMLALYAFAFGSYGASFFSASEQALLRPIFISLVIVLFTVLNAVGAEAVGRAETAIVVTKLAILLLFVGVGAFFIEPGRLEPSTWASPVSMVAGGMLIFLAYEGFELIANTAHDVRVPARTLPRAYFAAVGFVIVLYVAVSAVAVGNLSIPAIVAAKDYALAQAAGPFLGRAGFALIAVAAMLSTGSAINATLYGAARVSYIIAKEGELPPTLDRNIWHRPLEGLLITAAVTLLVANLFDLSSIATMGSSGFLLIFATVNAANLKLRHRTQAAAWPAAVGLLACLAALAILLAHTAETAPRELLVLLSMIVLALLTEAAYRKMRTR